MGGSAFIIGVVGILFAWAVTALLLHLKVRSVKGELEKAWAEYRRYETKLREDQRALAVLAQQKSSGFPWLANALSEYEELRQKHGALRLEQKIRPAVKEAERIKAVAAARRNVEAKLREAQYLIEYWQTLFPFLEEFKGDVDDDVLRAVLSRDVGSPIERVADLGFDPVRVYSKLPQDEYDKLSDTERNQLALDRYISRRMTKREVGQAYERYVGYLFERDGFEVYYQGILEGFDDLGRDVVAMKDGFTWVVQCKCWSSHKTIHENHINQLFGTATKYAIMRPDEQVNAAFYTSTTLSDRAREFAQHLGITVREGLLLNMDYPMIKCVERGTTKIYHLPFDQQYDRIRVGGRPGRFYMATACEAEAAGFRRALRWQGNDPDES